MGLVKSYLGLCKLKVVALIVFTAMVGMFLATMPPFDDRNIRADIVFFEVPGGGACFSVGSIAFAGAMAHDGYDNDVARLVGNVLARFVDATPFDLPEDARA